MSFARVIKQMCQSMTPYERVHENRLRNVHRVVSISEEQFGFAKGNSTTDAIFALRRLQERYREGQQDLHRVIIDLEKNIQQNPEGRTVLGHDTRGYQRSTSDW